MSTTKIYFNQFLENAFENGQYATDDVIAFVLPLFEEVLSFHEASLVAPFDREDALFITEGHLDIDETLAVPATKAIEKLAALFAPVKSAQFDIIGKREIKTDVEIGNIEVRDLQVHFNTNEPLLYPAYIRGYNCFETLPGHHDVQTDIFCLGLVLGSMAMSVNLYDEEDVHLFARYRNNPVQFNQRIHPTISSLITEMTELDRKKRTNNLYDVINRLHHYREYDPEKQTDLSKVAGWVNKEIKERRQFILNKLRNRLFDTSRRNRLLYYKPNMRFVNLTISSVPMVLHYQSIRTDLLFTWNSAISSRVTGMKEIVLNKYLRFEDHPYLSAYLDKIRLESQRNINEYGFSQLKMVITFLNWHNLKENSAERIQSPLLLIPVEVKKIKRIKPVDLIGGLLDSIGGGGWGPIVTTTLIAGGRNFRYAIGSSHAAKFFVALISTITFISVIGLSHWQIIFGLVIGSMAVAPFSIYLSTKISNKWGLILVGLVVIIVSLRTFFMVFFA